MTEVEGLSGCLEADEPEAHENFREDPFGMFCARDAVESSPTATVVVDRNCRVFIVNPEAKRILELEGEGPPDIWEEMSGSGRALFRRVVGKGETLKDHRLRFQKSKGKARVLSMNAAPVRGSERMIIGAVATFIDITAQTWVEDALQLYMDRLAILRDLDRAILAVRPPSEIAELAFQGIFRLVPCDNAVLCCVEPASGRLISLLADGKRVQRDDRPPDSSGRGWPALMKTLTSEEVLLFPDTAAPADDGREPPEILKDYGRSVLLAPLASNGSPTGCLMLAARRSGAFGDEHATILKDVCTGLGVSLQNASLITTLERKGRDVAALARRLEASQEEERRRLSRELHDSIGQNLTAIGIRLNLIQDSFFPPPTDQILQDELSEVYGLIEATAEKIRDVMCDLRPPILDDLGLFAALSWLCGRTARKSVTSIRVTGAEVFPRLAPEAELTLFRIAQEALTNAVKHSRAREIVLDLRGDEDSVTLSVSDDGAGFDPGQPPGADGKRHWGMAIMRERALSVGGSLSVSSFPFGGTRVRVELKGRRRD